MGTALLLAFYILFPALIIYLCNKFEWINKIGAVIICYLAGIILGNSGLIPLGLEKTQELTGDISVAIALPLLLFSMDIKKWFRLAGKTMLSLLAAVIAVIVISFAGYIIIRGNVDDAWKLAGMGIGVYTGGTPNLAAIKAALSIPPDTFLLVHTYDTLITFIYLFFIISVGQKLFLKFLPPFRKNTETENADGNELETEEIRSYGEMLKPGKRLPLAGTFLLSVIIFLIAYLVSKILPPGISTSAAILTITTLGIAASFIKKIRNIENSFQLGMYIIYIFCLVVSSMAKIDMIININRDLMFFVVFMIFGTMFLHAILCRFFNVDTDTFLITSTAAICSPPFVPVVAGALKNKEVLLSGITTGIIGYAIGNYLGISFALIFKSLL